MKHRSRSLIILFIIMSMIMVFPGCSESSQKDSGSSDSGYTIDNIRSYVVGVDEKIKLDNGKTKVQINFDNAATTPSLQPVLDEVENELNMYGSIGRGFSPKSNHSTDLYNNTRDKVLQFVNADPYTYTYVHVNNTPDGLNHLASALITS